MPGRHARECLIGEVLDGRVNRPQRAGKLEKRL
jgi:hypothetical protein